MMCRYEIFVNDYIHTNFQRRFHEVKRKIVFQAIDVHIGVTRH
jgi:hypothetical protein